MLLPIIKHNNNTFTLCLWSKDIIDKTNFWNNLHAFNLNSEDIKDVYFIPRDNINILYSGAMENIEGNQVIYNRNKVIKINMELIRSIRNDLLSKTDLPLKIAEERRNESLKQKIIDQRNYLRDLPATINFNTILDIKQIMDFEPKWELN